MLKSVHLVSQGVPATGLERVYKAFIQTYLFQPFRIMADHGCTDTTKGKGGGGGV
jgi:hypothetical protein